MGPRTLATLISVLAFAAAPAAAHACGSGGYSYAGVSSRDTVYGVGAALTSLAAPAVQNGHVAGWVGVGGPGLGPNGSSEWIQVGYSGFPGLRVGSLYYEVALPGRSPTYHEVSSAIRPGATHRVAVLEVAHHTDWWRVWVDGHAVSRPYHLPGSHGAWRAIATAENWGGGSRACNLYSYRFNRVAVAHHPGGNWKLVHAVYRMHQGNNRYVPASTYSFIARTTTLPSAPQAKPTPPRAAPPRTSTQAPPAATADQAATVPADSPTPVDAATPVDVAPESDDPGLSGPGSTP